MQNGSFFALCSCCINTRAFEGCSSLLSITIPDSVTSIGTYAFYNCTSLTSITIPNSVNSIGGFAFEGCTSLENATIGDSITSISSSMFNGCTSLTSITIPASVTSIGTNVFYNCTSLKNVYYSGTASQWASITFAIATKANSNPLYYGGKLYLNETLATSITLEDITTINAYAFYNCTSIKSITIGENVTSINKYAFYGCVFLTEINFNATAMEDLSSENYIFYNARNSSGITVNIGAKVTKIPACLFYSDSSTYYAPSIKSVVFESNTVCDTIGSSAFGYCSSLTDITIPNSVTSIGGSAFSHCTSLTSITIPESVTSIGKSAFDSCTSLTSITIPDSITSIGTYTFYGCTSLENITIPDSVTSIETSAFYGCTSLTSFTIPDTVTSIGSAAFGGCSSLESITLPFVGIRTNATSVSSSTLFGYIFGTSSYTGGTSTKQYYSSSKYTTYYIPTSLTTVTVTGGNILYGSFYNCSSLTNITLGDSVTSIGSFTFYKCTSLTSIIIGDSVTSIGESAFYNCTALENIIIGNSVTSIEGNYTFDKCTSLSNVYYCGTASQWASISFESYNSNPLSYANYLYINGELATDITIEDITSVNARAFNYYTSLNSITIGRGVTSIDNFAFYNCTSLESVYYGGTADEWSAISIGSGNTYLTAATLYYYSETEPDYTDGYNYWRYVDGEIVVWTEE